MGLLRSKPFSVAEIKGIPSDFFGDPIVFAGDTNGDGYGDILVGAPGNSASGKRQAASGIGNAGSVFAISRATGSTLKTWEGGFKDGEFGREITLIHDQNGDDIKDFLISEPGLN
ncbi:MAG: FG-GAP repeat protein [Planctomycetes bacterium]|nr:FG-GAP repeat protein [Planctomycetota bacterium]